MKILPYLIFNLIILPFLIVCQQPYKINKINKAGIFFHQLGEAKISPESFTLLSFTNISIYEDTLNLIKRIYPTSVTLCYHPQPRFNNTSKDQIFRCEKALQNIQNRINSLDEKFNSITHLTGHTLQDLNFRSKRGLFDGVSSAFKWLFGTPSAEDAKYYSEAIANIQEQNRNFKLLMKHQIHIISEAIESYNKSASALKFNEEKLNENVMKFNKFSDAVVTQIDSLNYYQILFMHISLLSQMITELGEDFDVIIASILFAKQNVLHPSIINPKHLREELMKVRIQGSLEFPVDVTNVKTIHKYFTISKLSVVYFNNILIYAIKIPLVNKELYQLYNLIPLPIQMENTTIYSYIDPQFPYFLLSTSRIYYGQMKDLSSCTNTSPGDFICEHRTIYLVKDRPTCETELKLKQLTKIPGSCKTHTIKSNLEVWHPLSRNQWLYVLTAPTLGTISCENNLIPITDTELQGTGIFTLEPNCKCYTLSTLLVTSTNLTSNYTNYIPSVDITSDECCIQQQEYLKNDKMEAIKLQDLSLDELRHVQFKLQQHDKILQKTLEKPFIVVHTMWYNLGLAVAASIILIYCCCCKCFKCRFFKDWFHRTFRRPARDCLSICINSHNTINSSPKISRRSSITHRLQDLDTALNDDELEICTQFATTPKSERRFVKI